MSLAAKTMPDLGGPDLGGLAITADAQDGKVRLLPTGDLTIRAVQRAALQLNAIVDDGDAAAGRAANLIVDMQHIDKLDMSGAWILLRLRSQRQALGANVEFANVASRHKNLLEALSGGIPEPPAKPALPGLIYRALHSLGRTMVQLRVDAVMSLNVIGAAVRGSQMKFGHSGSFRPISIIHHIDRMGVGAVPIMILMSFLIGAIIAQQSAFQLTRFGAEVLVVDLTAILVVREISVLLTAIMVAGRTGSAMTAEIGAMRMRDEIDALTVIGLNPIGILVFPRMVALIIALPALSVLSNISGLVGAGMVLNFYSGMDPEIFILKLRDAVELSTVFAGLIKAPFMAVIIAVMAAIEGMKVEGSTESLGQHVTAAVVKSIFFVILVDGFFAIFYAQINYG